MNSLTYTVSEIIRYASIFSICIPLAIYLSRFRIASRQIHILGVIVIVSLVCDAIGYYLGKHQMPTAIVSNSYVLLFFCLMSWYYLEILFNGNFRLTFLISTSLYAGVFLYVTFYVQSFSQNQSLMWSATGLMLMVYAIAYFRKLLLTLPVVHLHKFTPLWINSAILFYFGLNLALFLLSNYVLTKLEPDTARLAWSFHNLNNIIKNILFAIGIYHWKK